MFPHLMEFTRRPLLMLMALAVIVYAQVQPKQCDVDLGHNIVMCAKRNLTSMLETYPTEFGEDHSGMHIMIAFDHNELASLTAFPATNASISFSCRYCQMMSVAPNIIASILVLHHLDLSHNLLKQYSFADEAFTGGRLEQLFLSHNQIESLQPELLAAQSLQLLDLSHNRIKTIEHILSPVHFVTLEILSLSFNQLTDFPASLVGRSASVKLHTLELQDNEFDAIPTGLAAVGSSLKFLDISGNRIVNVTSSSFTGLNQLNTLTLGRSSELINIDVAAFEPLTSLKILSLNDSPKLTTLNLTGLQSATGLEILDLTNCSITTLHLNRTDNTSVAFPKLHEIRVRHNPWHCDCALYSTIYSLMHVSSDFIRFESEYDARCHTPYALATDFLVDLLVDPEHCTVVRSHKPHWEMPLDPPYYLRPRIIILSVAVVLGVVLIGLTVGLLIVCVQTRLRANSASIDSPVRYTTVRNSQQPTTIHGDEMYTL